MPNISIVLSEVIDSALEAIGVDGVRTSGFSIFVAVNQSYCESSKDKKTEGGNKPMQWDDLKNVLADDACIGGHWNDIVVFREHLLLMTRAPLQQFFSAKPVDLRANDLNLMR